MGRKSFIASTLILIVTGLIIKVLGFFYRVYLSNLIGAEGMGLFQLISPVYSTIILTLTSGISVAVSRLTAKELGRGNYENLRKITLVGLAIVTVSGILVSIIMHLNRSFITEVILKDSRIDLSLALLIPLIPIVAASSAIKGYFYGVQDVIPSATSQLIEQLVKMVFVMSIAQRFAQSDIALACGIAVGGMALGEIASFIFIFIRYKFYPQTRRAHGRRLITSMAMNMLAIAIPVSATRLITSIMSTIEVVLIPRRLVLGGFSYQLAMEEYGKLMGMAIPLVYMPSFITSALAVTLIPAISESMSAGSVRAMKHRTSKAIKFTVIAGCVFTVVFMTFSHEISGLVYKRQNIGHILYLLAFTCVFVYLQQTLHGIMNGLGKQGALFWTTIIGSLIRIVFVYFMVPSYGISGYVWGMIISLAVTCIVNLWLVAEGTGVSIDVNEWFAKPGIITSLFLPFGRYFYYLYGIFNIQRDLKILIGITTEVCAIGLLLIITGVISIQEVLELLYIKRKNKMKIGIK